MSKNERLDRLFLQKLRRQKRKMIEQLENRILYLLALRQSSRREKSCPELEDLTVFVEGKLSDEQRELIISHLSICEQCREFTRVMLSFEGEELFYDQELPFELTRWAKGSIFTKSSLVQWARILVRGALRRFQNILNLPVKELAPVVVRGAGIQQSGYIGEFSKELSNYRVKALVEGVSGGFFQIFVKVADKEEKKPNETVRVSLFDRERELESYLLEEGSVVFDRVYPGSYLVLLSEGGRNLGGFKINLRGEKK